VLGDDVARIPRQGWRARTSWKRDSSLTGRTDTDLRGAVISIRWQITQLGWQTAQGAPKSDVGELPLPVGAEVSDGVGVEGDLPFPAREP
jgi:hypothetical protein